jgi:biotin carboxylase
MKTILVLGAGVYQVPLIQRARDRGLRTIAASWSEEDPGMNLADERWVVDTKDRDRLLDLAKRHSVGAVVTAGTDVAVTTLGYICEQLRLPGLSYRAALNCTNKVLMQERLRETKIPAATFCKARSFEELEIAIGILGLPAIVKAPDSSGSRGITVVEQTADLPGAYQAAVAVSRCGEVLVEELLRGTEFGAQAIVVDGEVCACLPHNDIVTPPPICVPIGHSYPCSLPKGVQQQAQEICTAAIRALGIRNAVCNCDLIATTRGVCVLEIGARLGATGIAEMIHAASGRSLRDGLATRARRTSGDFGAVGSGISRVTYSRAAQRTTGALCAS